MPLRRAFSIASATARSPTSTPPTPPAAGARPSPIGPRALHPLDAPDLAGRGSQREPDRADAAVQVVYALAAAEAGELDRGAVEALGHLGVGLEERVGRDAEAQSLAGALQFFLDHGGAGQQVGLTVARGLGHAGAARPQDAGNALQGLRQVERAEV